MSGKENVVLVSRALAAIQIVTALLEISYLPQSFAALWEHASPLRLSDLYTYWSRYYIEDFLALILRIVLLLFIAQLFWKCGPKIEQILLPAARPQDPA